MRLQPRWLLAGLMVLALAGCGGTPSSGSGQSSASGGSAAKSAATPQELCAIASLTDVQTVIGGTKLAVTINEPQDSPYVTCEYMDQVDSTISMRIDFVTPEKLATWDNDEKTAAAYYDMFTNQGQPVTPVAGLGEKATWKEMGSGTLYVLKGDQVIMLESIYLGLNNPTVRAKIETLAGLVVERMP